MVGAALHGISHAQEEALISAGEHLKAHGSVLRPVAGKLKGMTGDVRVLRAGIRHGLEESLAGKHGHGSRHMAGKHAVTSVGLSVPAEGGVFRRFVREKLILRLRATLPGQGEVKEAVRVVVGGAEHLSSGKIFPGGGNAAVENHSDVSMGSLTPKRGSVVR